MRGRERRWKLVGLLALGMAIGVTMTATPAVSHVAGWAHNWNEHIKPKADARYANAVRGTDKARNSDKLDGQDSSKFLPAASYTVAGDWTLGVSDPRTNGKKAELSCDPGDLLLNGGYLTGSVNNPNHFQGSWRSGQYVAGRVVGDRWRVGWLRRARRDLPRHGASGARGGRGTAGRTRGFRLTSPGRIPLRPGRPGATNPSRPTPRRPRRLPSSRGAPRPSACRSPPCRRRARPLDAARRRRSPR
jgi:hypothetical protein